MKKINVARLSGLIIFLALLMFIRSNSDGLSAEELSVPQIRTFFSTEGEMRLISNVNSHFASQISDEYDEPSIMGNNEIEFIISHAEFYPSYILNEASLAILGTLRNHSDERQCVRARQIKLILDGEEYSVEGPIIGSLQIYITPERDFVSATNDHCIDAGNSEFTFVAFSVPMETPETIEFTFDQNSIEIHIAFPIDTLIDFREPLSEVIFPANEATRAILGTFTPTPIPTRTNTPRPTVQVQITYAPTATPILETQTLFINSNGINVRSCARINNSACPVVDVLQRGDDFEGIEIVTGDSFSGSTQWWHGLLNSEDIYVHSSFVSTTRPANNPAPPPVNNANSSNSSGNTNQSPATNSPPPAQGSQWTCGGNIYNCPDFANRCSELYDYFRTCPGDPSDLDGDDDGRPCETQCGG